MKLYRLFILFFSCTIFSQENIPTDYFSLPLDIPLLLSGNFGELRSNHFHSGLDIKTQQKEGFPVYAPADGYVSRIKVSHYGYGKALYIKHPNGYSTVYAHLQNYAGIIQEYVKQNQYKKEEYEIELFPENNLLQVKKGEVIGYTGNSGSSGGPHLHYEIRDAASRPMNPLLFGIDIPDTKIPLVNSVFVYPSSKDAVVNQSQIPLKFKLTRQKDGSYVGEKIKAFGKIGFGISTYDQQNGASNKNGTYKISSKHNGMESFEVLFNKFSFDETRYLNRFMDYEYFKNNKSRVQKLFRESNNPLSVITKDLNNGYITIEDGYTSVYTITVSDFKENEILITIPIQGIKEEVIHKKPNLETQDYIYASQATSIKKGNFNVYIPSETLYEDAYLDITIKGDTIALHEDVIPLHKNITITAEPSNYNAKDFDKLYIGEIQYRGMPYYSRTYKEGGKLSTRVNSLGTYCIAIDSIAPKITPLNFKQDQWISNENTLKIKIEDAESGVSNYRATINEKFILTEYDAKNDVLVYDFNDQVNQETKNNLKLIVVDNVGNSTTFEATFFRKQP